MNRSGDWALEELTMDDRTLPLDDLDPCCQKEILLERNRAAVTKKLRRHDKLSLRNDALSSVFCGPLSYKECLCCRSQSVDYPLLAKVRRRLDIQESTTSADNREGSVEEDSDDDDEMWAGLEFGAMLPEEEERLLVMQEKANMVQNASLMGFSKHMEDSIHHLNDMILEGRSIVCHFNDINLMVCAYIDNALEILATKYLGTLFRRIEVTDVNASFITTWNCPFNVENPAACLVVFINGALTSCTFDIHQFGEENATKDDAVSVYVDELEKYLDHAGCLHYSCPESVFRYGDQRLTKEINSDSDEERESYCDLVGCGRHFPHEHVGENGGSILGASSSSNVGSDALPDNWRYKM